MDDAEFIGATGRTGEVIMFPKRKVTYTFTHERAGDERFMPMVFAAMIELMAELGKLEGDINDYTASNGVRVRASYPTMDYPEEPKIEVDDYTISSKSGENTRLSFVSVPKDGGELIVTMPDGRSIDLTKL